MNKERMNSDGCLVSLLKTRDLPLEISWKSAPRLETTDSVSS